VNAVDRYKTLPEAHAIPDVIWDLAKEEEELDELTRRIAISRERISELQKKSLKVLRVDWSDSDLQKAGLL
jgi:DNA-directed RNA polymerase sigma subunit (sigma70/sigma32)